MHVIFCRHGSLIGVYSTPEIAHRVMKKFDLDEEWICGEITVDEEPENPC